MKSIQTSTLLNNEFSYNILNSISVEATVDKNDFLLPLDALFMMAARINKKRSFLFVSKLLGKHLPINPTKGLLAAALLAARYFEEVKGGSCELKKQWIRSFLMSEPVFTPSPFIPGAFNPLIIGFAETATALGHAFFDCFEGADYVHTTREMLLEKPPVITFEEEHSHATSHRVFLPLDMIADNREIILVDDELTTGKTALNIIRSIHARFPRKEYSVVTILDWRSEANKREFEQLEKLLGITIHVVSLVAGSVRVSQQKDIFKTSQRVQQPREENLTIEPVYLPSLFDTAAFPAILSNGQLNDTPFLKETGRFGISSYSNRQSQQKIVEAAVLLAGKRCGRKTLCLGTGEFMYLPMRLAAEMGAGIFYQSTTRSPIYIQNEPEYGARYGLAFPNPEDQDIAHYVYNIPPGYYDELFLFFERETDEESLIPLLNELKKTQIPAIKLVYFVRKKG